MLLLLHFSLKITLSEVLSTVVHECRYGKQTKKRETEKVARVHLRMPGGDGKQKKKKALVSTTTGTRPLGICKLGPLFPFTTTSSPLHFFSPAHFSPTRKIGEGERRFVQRRPRHSSLLLAYLSTSTPPCRSGGICRSTDGPGAAP